MKKKNWVICAVATVVSILLLILWYALGFNHVDAPLDLVISIIWWLVLAASVVLIVKTEQRRREAMRTLFVGETMLFNPERGLVELGEDEALDVAMELLDGLDYGFDTENMTGHIRPMVKHIVYTTKFKLDDDVWEGEVLFVEAPDSEPVPFENRFELAQLLGAPAPSVAYAPTVIPAYPAAAVA